MTPKRLTTAAICLAGLFLIVFVPYWVTIFRSREEGWDSYFAGQLLALLFCFLITAIVLFFLHRANTKGNQHLHELANCALWWSAISVMYFVNSVMVVVMFFFSVLFAVLAFFLWLEVAKIVFQSGEPSNR